MALMRIAPVEARVRWDRAHARPGSVRWGGHAVGVVGLAGVRDERAAYPRDRGPRITYLLHTADGGQASLVYDELRRRWYVEAIDLAA